MEHISYHDICIIMDALELYTERKKVAEEICRASIALASTATMTLLQEDIEESIRLNKFFSKVGDQLAVIDEDLSVNIVAKFHEA